VVGEDGDQLVAVLRLQQRLDRALGQRGEGLVGRREDGERTLALQRVDQAGGLDGGDQRLEAAGGDRGVDDVGLVVAGDGVAGDGEAAVAARMVRLNMV
jgi:hypothetical protein